MMSPEGGEQLRFADLAGDPAPGLGRACENALDRHTSHVLEDQRQALAQGLRPVRLAGHAVPGVAGRPRDGQKQQVSALSGEDGGRVPEIDLADPGGPFKLEEPLAPASRAASPPVANEPLDRGKRARMAAFVDKPVMNPFRRMTLLGRTVRILFEPGGRDIGKRLHRRARIGRPGRRRGRAVLAVGVFGDRVAGDACGAGNLANRGPVGVHAPDSLLIVPWQCHVLSVPFRQP